MLKARVTQREVKDSYPIVVKVPYCALQFLLRYESPRYYTATREGWGSDIYTFEQYSSGVAISTGYAPFGTFKLDYKVGKKWDDEAREIYERYYGLSNDELRTQITELLKKFLDECVQMKAAKKSHQSK